MAACAACVASPRLSTPSERDSLYAVITTAETAVTVAALAGKIPPADLALVQAQIAELRALVASTETTPTDWAAVLNKVALLSAAWIVRQD